MPTFAPAITTGTIDVFRDVANAAADRERIINEANGYASSIIPRERSTPTTRAAPRP